MTPTLHFAESDTRTSALQKAGVWYDRILDEKLAAFATAIGQADVSCDVMFSGIHQAQLAAVQGRAPFLADGARVLDEVIAMRRGEQRATLNQRSSDCS